MAEERLVFYLSKDLMETECVYWWNAEPLDQGTNSWVVSDDEEGGKTVCMLVESAVESMGLLVPRPGHCYKYTLVSVLQGSQTGSVLLTPTFRREYVGKLGENKTK